MKRPTYVLLLHNPKAGDQGHLKEELINIVESQGFKCQYSSLKDKGWNRFKRKTELVVVVGGDGTIRGVMKKLLNRKLLDKPMTIALIPSGTANNFARALGVSSALSEFKRCLAEWVPKKIDIGVVSNLRNTRFFLEGLGCGLIPELIKTMKEVDLSHKVTAEQELHLAKKKLLEIVKTYPANRAKVTIDGRVYEDDYLMVEVLNIKSVGPNLVLAPGAAPTDSKLEVVLLRQTDRAMFADYVRTVQFIKNHRPLEVPWEILQAAEEIIIYCENQEIHIDDELVKLPKGKGVKIEIRPGIVDVIT